MEFNMKNLFLLTFLFVMPIMLTAQSGSNTQYADSTDRWDKFDDENYEANWSLEDNFKYGFFGRKNAFETNAPTIDLLYGNMMPVYDRKEFIAEFAPAALAEVRLGLRNEYKLPPITRIHEYSYSYLSAMYASNKLGGLEEDDKLNYNAWILTLANHSGYGYRFTESMSLTFYNSNGITFTINDFTDNENEIVKENAEIVIDKFSENYHFGENFEAGLKLRLIYNISLDAGFERNAIYRRHMFWMWTGQKIVQGVADGFLDWFLAKVEKSSPVLLPVVHFVLKNAIDYSFYELQKDKMNWPFDTEEALIYDQFKVGLSINM